MTLLTLSGTLVTSLFVPEECGHGRFEPGNVFVLDASLACHKGSQNPFEWVKQPEVQLLISQSRWNKIISDLALKNGLTPTQFKQYVYWCIAHPLRHEQKSPDNPASSVDRWLEWLAFENPGLALSISRKHVERISTNLDFHRYIW